MPGKIHFEIHEGDLEKNRFTQLRNAPRMKTAGPSRGPNLKHFKFQILASALTTQVICAYVCTAANRTVTWLAWCISKLKDTKSIKLAHVFGLKLSPFQLTGPEFRREPGEEEKSFFENISPLPQFVTSCCQF
jgi:hypothetical protein